MDDQHPSGLNNQKEIADQRRKLSYIEGWLSVFINTILFGLKYWAGVTSGSVAVMADAWHTLSDSMTSIVVLVGAKISGKSADEEHPFGHDRAELIASIIIGVLLAVVGLNFLIEAINRLRHHETAEYDWFVVFVFVLSILFKEGLAQFSIRAGKKTGSRALKADGWHHRSDAIASFIIVIGVFVGHYFWWVDGVLGILVALLILYATYEIMRESINPLIGEKPNEQLINRLQKLTTAEIGKEFDLHHIHVHNYGASTELTFHIKFLKEIGFKQAHKSITRIEKQLKDDFNIDATIHFEPDD
ncbi:cation diffusion facilitator family transporter [bacterium]|nr:cation diffusion facilitator family transporter [bacterium]